MAAAPPFVGLPQPSPIGYGQGRALPGASGIYSPSAVQSASPSQASAQPLPVYSSTNPYNSYNAYGPWFLQYIVPVTTITTEVLGYQIPNAPPNILPGYVFGAIPVVFLVASTTYEVFYQPIPFPEVPPPPLPIGQQVQAAPQPQAAQVEQQNAAGLAFQATMDGGVVYNFAVLWNLFGQRYFVKCTDQNNNVIFNVPLVETPPALPITALAYDIATQLVTVTTATPHGVPYDLVDVLSVEGCVPNLYNGTFPMIATSPTTLQYNYPTNPGNQTTLGTLNAFISLTTGYFVTTMVYRNSGFEIWGVPADATT
jgi:hypothetical protein